MSRRPTNNSAGVSLFPFLAVLVCTMGSLILLLIVTTKRIRAAAIEKARQAAVVDVVEREPVAPEIELQPVPVDPSQHENAIREWQTQLESLAHERDTARESLTELERKLVAAQSAVLRSQQTATTKKDKLKEARGIQQQAAADRERLQNEIDATRDALAASEQRLIETKERQKTAQSKFAFVPFDGRNGTTRRPILIECTDKFIRFVPEDIRLTPAELNGFTAGFNPLLNASRELIHYWNAYDRIHADEQETEEYGTTKNDLLSLGNTGKEPYVLLLVRPGGAISFLIAKNLLGQLKIPHGYELLDDDMELEFSEPNPDAKQICQQTVTQTLSERENVLQLVASNRNLQRDQLRLETNTQSFVPIEQSEPTVPATGTRSVNRGGMPSNKKAESVSGAFGTSESPSGNGAESFGPNSNGESTATGNDNGAANNIGAVRNAGGTPARGASPRGKSNGAQADAVAAKRTGVDQFRGNGRRPESDFVHSDDRESNQTANSNSLQQSSRSTSPANRSRSVDDSDFGNEPTEESLPSKGASLANDNTKPFPMGRPNRSATMANGSATPQPRQVTNSGSNDSASATATTSSTQKSQSGSNSRSAGSPAGDRGPSGQRSSGSGDMRQHKRRYTMPRSGIGLEKAITIRIWSNRLLISDEFEIPVDTSVRTESLVERVLMALDREQASWPSAGVGYHWVPTLKYEVAPGGDQVHERLNSALFDLGLVSSVTYLDTDPDAATKPKRTTPTKLNIKSNEESTAPSRETSRTRATGAVGIAPVGAKAGLGVTR